MRRMQSCATLSYLGLGATCPNFLAFFSAFLNSGYLTSYLALLCCLWNNYYSIINVCTQASFYDVRPTLADLDCGLALSGFSIDLA